MPVVIFLGLGISIASITALQVLAQNSLSLNTQYYAMLAREAAQSGVVAATKCIEMNTMDWDTSGNPKLQPQTNCDGDTVAGKPTTVVDDTGSGVQSTYTVDALQNPYGNTTRVITSTGTVTIKNPLGQGIALASKTVRTFGQVNTTSSSAVTVLSAGYNFACTVAGSQAYCWGANGSGQLGNGTTVNAYAPIAVDIAGGLGGKTVTAISTGTNHACAVADGQAYCWGANGSGQLGNNSTANSLVPVAVNTAGVLSGKTVTAISAGYSYTCAVADGEPYCWGSNWAGQLGNGTTANTIVPVAVTASGVLSGKTVTAISAGLGHSCAIASGAAYCWGNSITGQLGHGSIGGSNVPVAVSTSGVLSGKTVTAINIGALHTCAVADGRAYCWGNNWVGQLGNGSTASSTVPVAVNTSGVLNGRTVTAIGGGGDSGGSNLGSSCAIADGRAYCWGNNGNGQFGNGDTTNSTVPIAVSTSGILNGKTITSISVGYSYACAVANGYVHCWGGNASGELGYGRPYDASATTTVVLPGIFLGKTVETIGGGTNHTCATADGQVYCWGYNANGRLGDNTTSSSYSPVAVSTTGALSGKTVATVSNGEAHSCAIADGTAYCWGGNTDGQLGNNSTANSSTPVAVNTSGVLSGKTVTAISAGTNHTCAVADGRAYCWGWSLNGQLGNGSQFPSLVPVAVNIAGVLSGRTVTSISVDTNHTCAVADGRAYCWGGNGNGQLGNNSTANSLVPVAVNTAGVLGTRTVTAISAGLAHTCAVANGAAYCWGTGGSGQLGNNSTANSLVPVAVNTAGVLSGKTVDSINVGNDHSCAVADEQAYCWGVGSNGQLGGGTANNSAIPVLVSSSPAVTVTQIFVYSFDNPISF